eukprot:GEMP01038301.1.p1 GENE.GEMP01038301.1~~GEMP01038301.1.p1  ORF type:complete len:290 (+),score=76.88 GEMP01038301.1:24-893(+)
MGKGEKRKGKGGKNKGKGKGDRLGKDENAGPNYHSFARVGQLEELKQASVNDLLSPDFLKRIPLHLAAFAGQVEAVEYICEKCPEAVLREAADGFLPVHFAAQQGHLAVVKALVKCAGCQPGGVKRLMQRVVKGNRTLLHVALGKQHTEVGIYLIEKGIDASALTDKKKLAVDFLDDDKKPEILRAIDTHQAMQEKKRRAPNVQWEEQNEKRLKTEIQKEQASVPEKEEASVPEKEDASVPEKEDACVPEKEEASMPAKEQPSVLEKEQEASEPTTEDARGHLAREVGR